MCLILWAKDCHPKFKLVLMANRDEFYNRPTSPAAFWSDQPSILAGKDELQGGTWMGLTTDGRFAALTNYRDPSNHNPHAPSRGHLVQNYLESRIYADQYMQTLLEGELAYNGFNLLAGTYDKLFCISSREKIIREIDRGVHGLSNSFLDVPWPKVTRGKQALIDIVQYPKIDVDDLFAIMADKELPCDHELPCTGMNLEWERILAPLYVESSDYCYGTRSTTIVLMDNQDKVQFWERSFTPLQPGSSNQVYYEFMVR
jgi:uncharacterized protein with NRDE domain